MSKIIEDLNGEKAKPCPNGDLINEYFQYTTKRKNVSDEKIKEAYETLRKMIIEVMEKDKEDKEGNVSKK